MKIESISKREIFIALAHRVKLNEANWHKKYLISLVEAAFLFKDNHSFANLNDLQNFLKKEDILQLQVRDYELKTAIDSLTKEKNLVKIPSGGWQMTEDKVKDVEKIVNEWLGLEEQAKTEWLNYIDSKYRNILQEEKNLLWSELIEKFVLKVFLRHGAETIRFIFNQPIPNEKEILKSINKILQEAISNIPENLKDIVQMEFPSFFDPNSKIRRKYLMGLLDSAFSHFAITMPCESFNEICNITSFDLTLFLDTNFLFSALDLHEHHMNESVKEIFTHVDRILKGSNGNHKIKFRYISDTLDEFIRTVDSCIIRFGDVKPSVNIARAAVRSEEFIGIDLAYFRKIAESNIDLTPKEFLEPYQKGAARILKKKDIEVYSDKALEDVRNSQQVIDDIHDFSSRLRKKKRQRQWETVQHDVRLWHFAKRLRESITPSGSLLENKYFILTCDYQFYVFDRYFKNKGKFENQLCLLPTQFLQILSLFIPRTDDFEKAFIHFIKIPMPRAISAETEAVSLKILKTIASYGSFSEDIAVALLTDEVLRTEIKNIREPEEIRKLIEDKLSGELKREREKYQEEMAQLRLEKEKQLLGKEAEITRLKSDIEQKEKKIGELEKQMEEFHRFKTEIEGKEKIKKEKKEKNKVAILRIFEVIGTLVICGLFYIVLLAYIPQISLWAKRVAVVLAFVIYGSFRFRKLLGPMLSKPLQWLAIFGSALNGIKIIWDIVKSIITR